MGEEWAGGVPTTRYRERPKSPPPEGSARMEPKPQMILGAFHVQFYAIDFTRLLAAWVWQIPTSRYVCSPLTFLRCRIPQLEFLGPGCPSGHPRRDTHVTRSDCATRTQHYVYTERAISHVCD